LKSLILFFFSLIIVGSFISESYGDEDGALRRGFSIAGGHPQKSKHDLAKWTFLPRLDMALHKSWDFEVEGNFSYYDISNSKNLYLLDSYTLKSEKLSLTFSRAIVVMLNLVQHLDLSGQ